MISEIRRVNLRESARQWQTEYDEYGRPVEQHLSQDYSRYCTLQRKLAAVGRELLDDFRLWQVTELGILNSTALRTVSLVWISLYTTGANPMELIEGDKMSTFMRKHLTSGLRRLVAWMLSTRDTTSEDRKWAQQLAARLEAYYHNQPRKPRKPRVRPKGPEPMSEDDLMVLHEVVERRHKAFGFRRPWMKPIMKLILKTGLGRATVLTLEREQVVEALAQHDQGKPAAISIWRKHDRSMTRLIPVPLVEEELRTLTNWPADWGTVADLVAPASQTPENRASTSLRNLRVELRAICEQAGLEIFDYYRLRRTLILITFRTTRDYLGVRQMFGMGMKELRALVAYYAPHLVEPQSS